MFNQKTSGQVGDLFNFSKVKFKESILGSQDKELITGKAMPCESGKVKSKKKNKKAGKGKKKKKAAKRKSDTQLIRGRQEGKLSELKERRCNHNLNQATGGVVWNVNADGEVVFDDCVVGKDGGDVQGFAKSSSGNWKVKKEGHEIGHSGGSFCSCSVCRKRGEGTFTSWENMDNDCQGHQVQQEDVQGGLKDAQKWDKGQQGLQADIDSWRECKDHWEKGLGDDLKEGLKGDFEKGLEDDLKEEESDVVSSLGDVLVGEREDFLQSSLKSPRIQSMLMEVWQKDLRDNLINNRFKKSKEAKEIKENLHDDFKGRIVKEESDSVDKDVKVEMFTHEEIEAVDDLCQCLRIYNMRQKLTHHGMLDVELKCLADNNDGKWDKSYRLLYQPNFLKRVSVTMRELADESMCSQGAMNDLYNTVGELQRENIDVSHSLIRATDEIDTLKYEKAKYQKYLVWLFILMCVLSMGAIIYWDVRWWGEFINLLYSNVH